MGEAGEVRQAVMFVADAGSTRDLRGRLELERGPLPRRKEVWCAVVVRLTGTDGECELVSMSAPPAEAFRFAARELERAAQDVELLVDVRVFASSEEAGKRLAVQASDALRDLGGVAGVVVSGGVALH